MEHAAHTPLIAPSTRPKSQHKIGASEFFDLMLCPALPGGDSLFSDFRPNIETAVQARLFQSPGGDSLFSDLISRLCLEKGNNVFQSPGGDSLFSDRSQGTESPSTSPTNFNPLAGIRCFLTWKLYEGWGDPTEGFQSPGGDSLFSDDLPEAATKTETAEISIPWRGFVVF